MPAAPSGPAPPGPPRWLDLVATLVAFAVVALGLAGVPLALVGRFRGLPVAAGTLAIFLALLLAGARLLAAPRPAPGRAAHVAALLAVAVASASAAVNVANAGQHLLIDGDPAVYAATGEILAHTGGLTLPTYADSLFGGVASLNFTGPGFFTTDGGALIYPQFLHLFPVLLAAAQRVGGTGVMLAVNPVLGGFALLAFYAFAARVLRPAWALLAMATLAVLLPEVHFARDAFSEIPSQLLVFTGLALLWDITGPRRGRRREPLGPAVVTGLVLGTSMLARVDAFFYLVPVAAALLLLRRGRLSAGVLAGLAVPAALALGDGYFGSPAYLRSILVPLAESTLAVAAIAVTAYAVRTPPAWLRPLGVRLASPAAGLVVALAGFAWFVRPHIQVARDIPAYTNGTISALQQAEGLPVDVPRSYDEQTMHWLSWYLGPVTLALGVLGLAWLVWRVMRGRDPRLAPFVLLTGAATAVYVWKPGVFPVQYWAARRFLPVSFPGLIVLALLLCAALWASRRVPVRAAGGVLGVSVLAVPLALLPGATLVRPYDGMLAAVRTVCGTLLPGDEVLLLDRPASGRWPQVIEAYCHLPAASAGLETTPADVSRVAAAAHAHGKRLVLLASVPNPDDAPPGLAFRKIVSANLPTEALSLSHRPDAVFPLHLELYEAVA